METYTTEPLQIPDNAMRHLRTMYPGHFDDQEIVEKFVTECIMKLLDPQEEINKLEETP